MLFAWVFVNGKKVDVATARGNDKESFKKELKQKGVKFDGIDRVLNW